MVSKSENSHKYTKKINRQGIEKSKLKISVVENAFKKFWRFLKKDSWDSFIVTLILAFLIIKFVFFPLLSFITGCPLPLVIVESCSMYHSDGWEKIFESPIYEEYGLTIEDAKKWNFRYGINKGDVVFVVGAKNLKVGDVIVFNGGQKNPIIHRVISLDPLTTKGDHNKGLLSIEKNIKKEDIIGKAVFRIPLIGWIKLIFFEMFKPSYERGFCS